MWTFIVSTLSVVYLLKKGQDLTTDQDRRNKGNRGDSESRTWTLYIYRYIDKKNPPSHFPFSLVRNLSWTIRSILSYIKFYTGHDNSYYYIIEKRKTLWVSTEWNLFMLYLRSSYIIFLSVVSMYSWSIFSYRFIGYGPTWVSTSWRDL